MGANNHCIWRPMNVAAAPPISICPSRPQQDVKHASCLIKNVLEIESLPQMRMSSKARRFRWAPRPPEEGCGGPFDGRAQGGDQADGGAVRSLRQPYRATPRTTPTPMSRTGGVASDQQIVKLAPFVATRGMDVSTEPRGSPARMLRGMVRGEFTVYPFIEGQELPHHVQVAIDAINEMGLEV